MYCDVAYSLLVVLDKETLLVDAHNSSSYSATLGTMAISEAGAERQPSDVRLPGSSKDQVESDDEDSEYDMAEPTAQEREILFEEEEREKLLRNLPSHGELKRTDNRSRGVRKRKKQHRGEQAELISEMEEGDLRDDTSSLSGSSSPELERERSDDGNEVRVGRRLLFAHLNQAE